MPTTNYELPAFVKRSQIRPNILAEYPSSKRVNAYILFADLRDFSNWSLTVPPMKVAEIFEVISERVGQMLIDHQYDYWKLMGDGIMLVWEVGAGESNTVDFAIDAAYELHKKYWYYWKESKSEIPKGFGISICGGEVIKYMSATYFEATIIQDYLGPIVNMASRFQSIAQPGEVLVNDSVKQHSQNDWYSFEDITILQKDKLNELKGIPESNKLLFKINHKYFNSDWNNFCSLR